MKKINILFLALMAVTLFTACQDETGDYVEQLFTNQQKELAFTTCMNQAADSAFNHLCVADGFYMYKDSSYRITFPNLQSSVFDTLNHHQLGYLVDSLILNTNRMAESCNKSVLQPIFSEAIKSLEFYNHDVLIRSDSVAITNFLQRFKYTDIKAAMQSPVSIRMNLFKVNHYWSQIVNSYSAHSTTPININLQDYIIDKMLDGIFEEMRLEEINIRTDSTHRVSADSLLGIQY